jgi:hypothetical protein
MQQVSLVPDRKNSGPSVDALRIISIIGNLDVHQRLLLKENFLERLVNAIRQENFFNLIHYLQPMKPFVDSIEGLDALLKSNCIQICLDIIRTTVRKKLGTDEHFRAITREALDVLVLVWSKLNVKDDARLDGLWAHDLEVLVDANIWVLLDPNAPLQYFTGFFGFLFLAKILKRATEPDT